MGTTKTAISVEDNLFQKLDELAKDLNMSRSRLFTVAAKDFLERHRNRELLEAINAAYEDEPTEEESKLLLEMRNCHFSVVSKE